MAETEFRRIAVLGTGLIGGSFALAVRKNFPCSRVVGWDKNEILRQAEAREMIHEGWEDLSRALAGADLIYLSLPVRLTLELLPEVARLARPEALVTDACSTKVAVCRTAGRCFQDTAARFLGGHPLAGKEFSGVAHADSELFRGAKYVLVGGPEGENRPEPQKENFVGLLDEIGAGPMWLDAETHDWAVAIVSHLPQLVSVALAEVIHDEVDESGLPVPLAGTGLRDALRLAGSPYAIWGDIALTNRDNIARALDRVAHAIERLRERLASKELEADFAAANELYKVLRELQ